MSEFLALVPSIDKISAFGVLVTVAVLVITDKLVWHTRLRAAENRADRWERIALSALSSGAEAGVAAAEVTAKMVSALPDPGKRGTGSQPEESP